MSLRYVWSRNNIAYSIGTKPITLSHTTSVTTGSVWTDNRNLNRLSFYNKPTIEGSKLVFPSSGSSVKENGLDQLIASDTSKCYSASYFITRPNGQNVSYSVPNYSRNSPEYESSNPDGYFYIDKPITITAQLVSNQLIITATPEAAKLPFLQTSAGALVATVSNASSSAYPPRSYAPKLANIWP